MTTKPVKPRPPLWKKPSITSGNLFQATGLAGGAALLALAATMTGPGAARSPPPCSASASSTTAATPSATTSPPAPSASGSGSTASAAPTTPRTTRRVPAADERDAVLVRRHRQELDAGSRALEEGADVRRRRDLDRYLLHRRRLCRHGCRVPGGKILFLATVAWNAVSTIVLARTPKGDYAKALHVLRSRPAPAPAH